MEQEAIGVAEQQVIEIFSAVLDADKRAKSVGDRYHGVVN